MDHDFGASVNAEEREQIDNNVEYGNNQAQHEQNQPLKERPVRSVVIDEDEDEEEIPEEDSVRQEQLNIVSPDTDHNYMLGVDHPKIPNPEFPTIEGLEIDDCAGSPLSTRGQLQRQVVVKRQQSNFPTDTNYAYGSQGHYYRSQINGSPKYVSVQQQLQTSPFFQRQSAPYKSERLPPTLRPSSRYAATNLDISPSPGARNAHFSHQTHQSIDTAQENPYDFDAPAPIVTGTRTRSLVGNKNKNIVRAEQAQPRAGYGLRRPLNYQSPMAIEASQTQSRKLQPQKRQSARNMQIREHQQQLEQEQRQFEEQQKIYLEEEEKLNADFWEKGKASSKKRASTRSPRKTTITPTDPVQSSADKPPDDPFLPPPQLPHATSTETPQHHSTFDASSIDGTINAVVRGEASVMQQHFGPPVSQSHVSTASQHFIQTHQQNVPTSSNLQVFQGQRRQYSALPPSNLNHQRLDELAELAHESANLLEQTTSSMARNITYQQQQPLYHQYQQPQQTLHFKVVQTSHQDEPFMQDYKQQQQVFTVQQQRTDDYAQHIAATSEQQSTTTKQRRSRRLSPPKNQRVISSAGFEPEQSQWHKSQALASVSEHSDHQKPKLAKRRSVQQQKEKEFRLQREIKSRNGEEQEEKIIMIKEKPLPEVNKTKRTGKSYTTRCICGLSHNDPFMIQCDRCDVWQHGICMGINSQHIPDEYLCEQCDPRTLKYSAKKAADIQQRAISKFAAQKQKRRSITINLKTKSAPIILKTQSIGRRKTLGMKQAPTAINRGRLSKSFSSTEGRGAQSGETFAFTETSQNQYSRPVRSMMLQLKPYVLGEIGLLKRLEKTPMTRPMMVTHDQMGLVATQGKITIAPGIPIAEYTGKVSFYSEIRSLMPNKQIDHEYTLILAKANSGLEDDIFVDATQRGSIARFVRRSCQPNASVHHAIVDGKIRIYLYASTNIEDSTEITIPFDYDYRESNVPVQCACGGHNSYMNPSYKGCPVAEFNQTLQPQSTSTKTLSSTISSPQSLQSAKSLQMVRSGSSMPSIVKSPKLECSPSLETPVKEDNKSQSAHTLEENPIIGSQEGGRRLRARVSKAEQTPVVYAPHHARVTRTATAAANNVANQATKTIKTEAISPKKPPTFSPKIETKMRESKTKPTSSSYADFLDPPVPVTSSQSSPTKSKELPMSETLPQKAHSSESSIIKKRGRPSGLKTQEMVKTEIQETGILSREERKMQATIASIERAEQLKESKKRKQEDQSNEMEESSKKAHIVKQAAATSSSSSLSVKSSKKAEAKRPASQDFDDSELWSELSKVVKERFKDDVEFQLPEDYNDYRSELAKKGTTVKRSPKVIKKETKPAKAPVKTLSRTSSRIKQQDSEILMASSKQAKEAALPIVSKSAPAIGDAQKKAAKIISETLPEQPALIVSPKSVVVAEKSSPAQTGELLNMPTDGQQPKTQDVEKADIVTSETVTAADQSRQPNTKAHKKLTIEEYRRKKKAEMEARLAGETSSVSSDSACQVSQLMSSSSTLSQSPIRQSPRKSFIPTIGSGTSTIMVNMPPQSQQIEEFVPSPPSVGGRQPMYSAPTVEEVKKKITRETGPQPGSTIRSDQEQSDNPPPLPINSPSTSSTPSTARTAPQQQQSLEERLKRFVVKKKACNAPP